jgi:4-phytase/acid phosphatase
LTRLVGDYYREHYRSLGLLRDGDQGAVYYWASPTQRTIATARVLAEALTPGGPNVVHSVGEGAVDPMFEATGKPDFALARAALLGQIGDDLPAWSRAHRDSIETLDSLLRQGERWPDPPGVGAGKRCVADVALGVSGTRLPGITGPEATAAGITESLLMAWADGRDFEKLGWKGLDEDVLLRVFALHQAEMDLRLRTPYIAQFASSHLAARLLATLEEGTETTSRHAPIGGAEPMVVVAGHDGTLVLLAGLLRLNWTVRSYQPGQVAPGGALIFERWRRASDGKRVIRLRYSVQTLTQLREARSLTKENPPASAPIFIPGGSEAGSDYDCPLDRFVALVESLIDPRFAGP